MANYNKSPLFYILLTIATLIFLFPIFYLVLSAIKPAPELYSFTSFWPQNPTLQNFVNQFTKNDFMLITYNTFSTAIVSTVFAVIINTMCGYALAKYSFKGDKLFTGIILAKIMMPMVLNLVPIFMILKALGMYNTLWALIIPPASTPTGIFMMRQYLLTVPDELIEAARIDGASEWSIFLRIIVPIARPVIATLTIFSFMWRWNDFLWPLVAISDTKKYTLQLAIARFSGDFIVEWEELLAMSALTMIPVLIVFLIFQREFVKSSASSGMKG